MNTPPVDKITLGLGVSKFLGTAQTLHDFNKGFNYCSKNYLKIAQERAPLPYL
jgi:hypothetical protein